VQAHSGFRAPTLMTVIDLFGGLVNAHGVVEALAKRESTGTGQTVSSSLLSAAAYLNTVLRPLGSAPTVPVCTDFNELANDRRFLRCLRWDSCTLVVSPWRFA
jgi:hypothetical protein